VSKKAIPALGAMSPPNIESIPHSLKAYQEWSTGTVENGGPGHVRQNGAPQIMLKGERQNFFPSIGPRYTQPFSGWTDPKELRDAAARQLK